MGYTLIDMTGQQFDRLTVLRRGPNRTTSARWYCQCVCGTICLVDGADLRRPHGGSKSCGCLQRERAAETLRTAVTKHGMADSPEYRIWLGIKKRCLNPTEQNYAYYGGRGITMCQAWQDSFAAFFADMGRKPGTHYSIERRLNDLGYNKDNCYWTPMSKQARNTRSNHLITVKGETRCLAEWLERYHMGQSTFHYRVTHGWSEEQALTTPPRPQQRHASVAQGNGAPLRA